MLMRSLIVTFCVIGLALAEQSPVFLWGATSPAKPALKTVPQNEFAELISPLLKDHMIVAFQEKSLSTNDFLCADPETSLSCYARLQTVSKKAYYPSVQNPAEALRSLTTEREHNSVTKSGKLQNSIDCKPGKVVFVTFDDLDENRVTEIQAHDAAIATITEELSCPVVYLYMSTQSTAPVKQNRVRRDTATLSEGHVFQADYQFLIFFTKLVYTNNGKSEDLTVTGMTVHNNTNSNNAYTNFTVSLPTSNGKSVNFDISLSGGYYTLSRLTYDNLNFRTMEINAPTDFSFYCGNLTLINIPPSSLESSTASLLWNSLQLQAPFGSAKTAKFVFGDAWHCVYFFTPAILSGLLIVALLLAITFTGICWMMDINTMDRFDDPKGKTITINASE